MEYGNSWKMPLRVAICMYTSSRTVANDWKE